MTLKTTYEKIKNLETVYSVDDCAEMLRHSYDQNIAPLTASVLASLIAHEQDLKKFNNYKGALLEGLYKYSNGARRGALVSNHLKQDTTKKIDGSRLSIECKTNGAAVYDDAFKATYTVYGFGETLDEVIENARIYPTDIFYATMQDLKLYRESKKMSDGTRKKAIQSPDWKNRNGARTQRFYELLNMGVGATI